MTPNFEDMPFKPLTVNENSAINSELDPDTIFFEGISSLDWKILLWRKPRHM